MIRELVRFLWRWWMDRKATPDPRHRRINPQTQSDEAERGQQ